MLILVDKPLQEQRQQLLNLFKTNFPLTKDTVCLDIGGVTAGFEKLSNICVVVSINLALLHKSPGWNIILADAKNLPFRDKSIDVAYSNAVFEHINNGKEKIVDEIKRTTKKGNLFVSVPYQYSPFDSHYLIPFFQFVPESVKKFLIFNAGLKIGWIHKGNYEEIKLFTKQQLKTLFPNCNIFVLKICFMPISLVAVKKSKNS